MKKNFTLLLIFFAATMGLFVLSQCKNAYLEQEQIDVARLDVAQSLIWDKQDFDDAIPILDSVMLNVPDNYSDIFNKQQRFWSSDDYSEYVEKTGKTIPCIWDAYSKVFYFYAVINIEKKNLDKAKLYLLDGLKQVPDSPGLLNELGMLYETKYEESFDKNYLYDAINYYDQAMNSRLCTKSRKARSLRGIGFCYTELGDLDKAEESYNYSLKMEDSENAYNELDYIRNLKNGGMKIIPTTNLEDSIRNKQMK